MSLYFVFMTLSLMYNCRFASSLSLCITMIFFCGYVRADSLSSEIISQQNVGFEDHSNIIFNSYRDLCNAMDIEVKGGLKESLCNKSASILLAVTQKRRITLQLFRKVLVRRCMQERDLSEEECLYEDRVFELTLVSTILLALCEAPAFTVIYTEYRTKQFLNKFGDDVYLDFKKVVACQKEYFLDEFYRGSEGEIFLPHAGIYEPEVIRHIELQLQNDIYRKQFDMFQYRLNKLRLMSEKPQLSLVYVLGSAVESKDIRFLKALIDFGVNPNASYSYFKQPLSLALNYSNELAAKLLLQAGADPTRLSYTGDSPLTIAAEKGYLDLVKRLLPLGMDVNGQVGRLPVLRTPIEAAQAAGNSEVVEVLLKSSH